MVTTPEQQKALEEFPASRPGPLSLTILGALLIVVLIADNYTLIKGLLGI